MAVPVAQGGSGGVGGAAEVQEGGGGGLCCAEVVVHEQELAQLGVVKGSLGMDGGGLEAGRLGDGVGVEGCASDISAAGPESDTAYLVRIGFAGHGVGFGAVGGAASGEAADGEVEAAPEEVDGAGFALELGTELVEYGVDGEQDAPEALDGGGIVGGVDAVLVEGNGIGDFDGHAPDFYFDAGRMEHGHYFAVEAGYGTRGEREGFQDAVAGFEDELVVEEVETKLEGVVAVGDAGGSEAAGGDVERDVPPVVDDRCERQADFADDLGVQVERGKAVLPGVERERGPAVGGRERHGGNCSGASE